MPEKRNAEASALAEALRRLPGVKCRPLGQAADIIDAASIIEGLPKLDFPINSAGELVDNLGGQEATAEVFRVPVKVSRLAASLNPSFFPIASIENFIEKIAFLLRRSPHQVNLIKDLGRLRPHLPKISYPLESVDKLLDAFSRVDSLPVLSVRTPAQHATTVNGDQVRNWISKSMGRAAFPIRSEEELYFKALQVLPYSRHPDRRLESRR